MLVDILGLDECLIVFKYQWESLARRFATVRFEPIDSQHLIGEKLAEIGSTLSNGFSFGKKIPISQEFELQRAMRVNIKVCWDDCGNMISKKVVDAVPLKKYQQILWNPHIEIRGEPIPVFFGIDQIDPAKYRWADVDGQISGFLYGN